MQHGSFVISLDFELMWGVRDKRSIESYGKNIQAVHSIIPRLLQLFETYEVAATFSTVGFLFFKNKAELLSNLPDILPQYINENLSPYNGHFDLVKNDEAGDLYHFAPHLIRLIQQHPRHEIGTHTFSHYYCLEPGQNTDAFRADLQHAIAAAKRFNIELKSLVFPRNQFNEQYLAVCREAGIACIRGNESSWLYEARNAGEESLFRRACRLADAYVNLSGHNTHKAAHCLRSVPVDIPSSRFLRPFDSRLKLLEPLRLKRIKDSMTHAARQNELFHLWWHPHNFGRHTDVNFAFLEKVLQHYRLLNREYGFSSYTMTGLTRQLKKTQATYV